MACSQVVEQVPERFAGNRSRMDCTLLEDCHCTVLNVPNEYSCCSWLSNEWMIPTINKVLIQAGERNPSQQLERAFKISRTAQFGRKMLENEENIALQISQILYTFALRAEICTTFEPKVVQTCLLHVDKNLVYSRNHLLTEVIGKHLFLVFLVYSIYHIYSCTLR